MSLISVEPLKMNKEHQEDSHIHDTQEIMSRINIYKSYAKYIPELNRREIWPEIVDRTKNMHLKKFQHLGEEFQKEIKDAFELVYDKKILPSMRSLQFAGKPIELNPVRIFNCSYLPITHYKAFGEIMFLLLSGTGVGVSVQDHHVEQLPEIHKPQKETKYVIGDSIEGWASAVNYLMKSYYTGKNKPRFVYDDIRPKGAPLVTAGGKAPGPEPLKICLTKIEGMLSQKKDGEKLSSLEVHDIVCHLADAVLAGGIRRAALISLFSFDDIDMRTCKHGAWWELNPQRGRANNSAVMMRSKITEDEFKNYWEDIKNSGSGEPGIFFTNDKDIGANPCCFVGSTIVATADGRNGVTIEDLAKESQGKFTFPVYSAREKENKSSGFWKPEIKNAVAFKTGEKPTMKVVLSDGTSFRCTDDHRLALPDGNYIEAKDSEGRMLQGFFTAQDSSGTKHRMINTFSNGYQVQHRMIWGFNNGVKPEDLVIDHKLNNGYDGIDNLQLLTKIEHDTKSGLERLGKDNGIHKIKDNPGYLNNLSAAASGEKNPNFSGLSDFDLISIGKECIEKEGALTREGCIRINSKFPKSFSKNRFHDSWSEFKSIVLGEAEYVAPIFPKKIEWVSNNNDLTLKDNPVVVEVSYTGEVESVYDLTVEDNHNFYILTKYDEDFVNSKGILVHNCEISLQPFQFCNLVEVNTSNIESQEDLNNRVKAATLIATLQASYTDFHFLRSEWKRRTEKEALIGVSLTGISDGKVLNYNLKEASLVSKNENERVANIIGINKSYRVTTVKPSGNSSVVLSSSSGVHARHSAYYWRRMRIGKNESIYKFLISTSPSLIEDDKMNPNQAIVKIAVKSPNHSIFRSEPAISFLERVKKVFLEWVKPGHRKGANYNNVSATCSIKDGEWEEVGEWMWQNKNNYTGISVLPYDGGTYVQAPYEECTEEDYLEFLDSIKNIELDFTKVKEYEDNTDLKGELACSGNGCSVV